MNIHVPTVRGIFFIGKRHCRVNLPTFYMMINHLHYTVLTGIRLRLGLIRYLFDKIINTYKSKLDVCTYKTEVSKFCRLNLASGWDKLTKASPITYDYIDHKITANPRVLQSHHSLCMLIHRTDTTPTLDNHYHVAIFTQQFSLAAIVNNLLAQHNGTTTQMPPAPSISPATGSNRSLPQALYPLYAAIDHAAHPT